MFSEIRASTKGRNGGGEGAEEERRQREEEKAKTKGNGNSKVPGSRLAGSNCCFIIGNDRRAKYFWCKASEVKSPGRAGITKAR